MLLMVNWPLTSVEFPKLVPSRITVGPIKGYLVLLSITEPDRLPLACASSKVGTIKNKIVRNDFTFCLGFQQIMYLR